MMVINMKTIQHKGNLNLKKAAQESTLPTKDRIQRKVYLHEDKALTTNEEDDSSVGDNSHKLSRQVTPIVPMSILSTVEKKERKLPSTKQE